MMGMIQISDAERSGIGKRGRKRKGDFCFSNESIESYGIVKNYDTHPCYECHEDRDENCCECGIIYSAEMAEEPSYYEITTKTNTYIFGRHKSRDEDLDEYFIEMMHDAENNSVKWDDYVEKRANEKEEARKREQEEIRIERENSYRSKEEEWLSLKPKQQELCISNSARRCIFLWKSNSYAKAYCRMGWDIIAEKGKKPIPKEPCVRIWRCDAGENFKRFIAFHGYDRFRKSYWKRESE